MGQQRSRFWTAAMLAGILLLASGCGQNGKETSPGTAGQPDQAKESAAAGVSANNGSTSAAPASDASGKPGTAAGKPQAEQPGNGTIQVIAKPAEITVLVNKTYKLPDSYEPPDLVDPDVPFVFKEKLEKRKMRKEAAAALEKLFKGAQDAGVPLAGVSAYRSHATQTSLYNNYVKQEGKEKADKYSARPGHSEHETGLSIDVTSSSGKCAAQDCFGATKEAKWLAEHANEYGFIIRYLQGKEEITGYQYEPWHLRYVGVDAAKEIAKQGITLEEYLGQGVPVANPK